MTNYEAHEIPLRYGKTNGTNIPDMPKDKFFVVGYNQRYGLVDVCNDNGDSYLEGRVNIENLLSNVQSGDQEDTYSQVEDYIMEAYNNTMNPRASSQILNSSSTPTLEILSYQG